MKTVVIALAIGVTVLAGVYIGSSFYYSQGQDLETLAKVPSHIAKVITPTDLKLNLENGQQLTIKKEAMSDWLETYHRDYAGQDEQRINQQAILSFLTDIAPGLQQAPVDATFIFENNQLTEQSTHKYGKRLNIEMTAGSIATALWKGSSESAASFDIVEPEFTTDKIRALGIEALLGKGESNFTGSPSSRIHNIQTAAAKYNGVIIGPGKEFSFNNILGTVEASTGYLPELVIKQNKTVPEFGGGICQVSTTLFRAAIESGLEITERKNHSFPVRYYNPQGYDATVYPGVIDLKFVNPYNSPILIQNKIEGTKIYFYVFGPQPDRKVTVQAPIIYEKNDDGSLKAYFVRKIISNSDEVVENKTFYSNYKSASLYPVERNPLE